MSLTIRSSYAILTASVLGLMTGCGEEASDGMGMEPEVPSDMQQLPTPVQPQAPQAPPGEDFGVQAASGITGSFDGVWGGSAYGWSCLPGNTGAPTYVWIWRWNGYEWKLVGQQWSTLYRADIVSVCGGSGYHAFSIPLLNSARGWYAMTTRPYGNQDPTLTLYKNPTGD
jgi:hypothetical protein